MIILGLLGTIIEFAAFKDIHPIEDTLYRDLLALASDPRNTVVVVSGRERALVSQWLGDLPVWIFAENGLYYRLGGRSAEWQSDAVEQLDDDWISSITPVFRYFEERTPGSVTETQEHSITWHYREADEDFGEIQASVLQEHLEKVLGNQPVEISLDSKQVQVRPYAVSKGSVLDPLMEACTDYSRSKPSMNDSILEERDSNGLGAQVEAALANASQLDGGRPSLSHTGSGRPSVAASAEPSEAGVLTPLDYVLCVGAWSMRDEDIFGNLENGKDDADVPYSDELPEVVWTCKVGEAASQAKHFVEDEKEVHSLIATLSSLSQSDARPPPEQSVVGSVIGDDGAPSLRGDTGDGVRGELVASALDHLTDIETRAHGHQLAFFLDLV